MALVATIIAAVMILVGLTGIIVPVLPGTTLIWLTTLIWGWVIGLDPWWPLAAIATTLFIIGLVLQPLIPGARLKQAGIPNRTLLIAVIAAVIGFFVIPVVGFVVGFVIGVWVAETLRVGPGQSQQSTVHALKAAAISYGLELATGVSIALTWVAFAIGSALGS